MGRAWRGLDWAGTGPRARWVPDRSGLPRAQPTYLYWSTLYCSVEVVDALVTAENNNYAVVLMGKNARAGAGLGMESGVSAESEVMEYMRKHCKGLRVKRFRMQYKDQSATLKRGVSGAQHLQILLCSDHRLRA